MQNLQKDPRSGVWRVRKQIPADVQSVIGKREVLVSTGTKDYSAARVQALPILADIEQQIADVRAGRGRQFGDQALTDLALAWVREIVDTEMRETHGDNPAWTGEDRQPVQSLTELQKSLAEFLARKGVVMDQAGPDFALLRRISHDWHHFYYPPGRSRLAPPSSDVESIAVPGESQALSVLYEDYKTERRPLKETQAQIDVVLNRFIAKFGDLPIKEISKAQALAFKDGLVKLPGLRGQPMKPSTINKQLGFLSGVFEFAVLNDRIPANPFRGVKAMGKSGSSRQSFEPEDLTRLFGPSYNRLKGAPYWLPLLALFEGARLRELVQLDRSDILEREGVWCLRLDTKHEGQRLKNESSRRVLPIHPKLIELGFIDYVRSILDGKVFNITVKSMSNAWAEYSDSCGITDPEKVFHSFRHSFIDGARRANMAESIQDRLTGHASPRMGSRYGSGHSITQLYEALSEVSFPGFPR